MDPEFYDQDFESHSGDSQENEEDILGGSFGTIDSKKLFEELSQSFMDCDVNCATCVNFIFALNQHIRDAHSQQNNTTDTDETKHGDFKNEDGSPSTNFSDSEISADEEKEDLTLNFPSGMNKTDHDTLTDSQDELQSETKHDIPGQNKWMAHLHNPDDTGTKKKRYRCDYCGKKYKYQSNLDLHVKKHPVVLPTGVGQRPYKCGSCPKKYKVQKMLDLHVKKHHTNSHKLKYVCAVCEERFLNKIRLCSHVIKKHPKERGKIVPTCVSCGKNFTRATKLAKHFRAVHGRELPGAGNNNVKTGGGSLTGSIDKTQLCEHAEPLPDSQDEPEPKTKTKRTRRGGRKKSKNLAAVQKTQIIPIIPIVAKMFHICEYCPEKFETRGMLSDHFRRHHTNLTSASTSEERPYTCEFCPKEFKGERTLKQHVNRYHKISDKKTVVCVICDERFLSQSKVDRHIFKKHPYDRKAFLPTCKECGMSFAKEGRLVNHMKGCPDWKKRFSCSTCGKKFGTAESLFQHMENKPHDIVEGKNQEQKLDFAEPKKIKLEKL